MPPTPTLQGAWVRLDASLVEQWVNGEAEVELDLLDVGRVKVAVTQREVVDERFVILRGYLQGQSQSRVTLRMPRRMVGAPQAPAGSVVQMPPSAVNQPNSPVAQPVSAPSVDSLDVLILYTQGGTAPGRQFGRWRAWRWGM